MSQPAPVRFDDALPGIVEGVLRVDPLALAHCIVLRSADGRMIVVFEEQYLTTAKRRRFAKEIAAGGGAYADPDTPCANPSDLFQDDIFTSAEIAHEIVLIGGKEVLVRLLDRRIVAQDWNRINFEPIGDLPPVVSFYSCKGGVGRSTALAIAAAGLAEKGLDILIVDLDIEAPGLGALLLEEEERPEFGAIDYLVENDISGVTDEFARACIAPSSLIVGRSGSVDVLPAVGSKGASFPQNVIAKLGRALLDGPEAPLVDQIRSLVSDVAATRRYDAIFVDVRAGLSESSAAALLSLGGDMLLFGVDTPQTFESYRYLFAHLARYAPPRAWRNRLQMVQAKAAGAREDTRGFRESASDLFAEFIYDDSPPDTADPDVFNFDVDDDLAPHYPIVIEFDATYLHFDPRSRREQLERDRFGRAFGKFVQWVEDLITPLDHT